MIRFYCVVALQDWGSPLPAAASLLNDQAGVHTFLIHLKHPTESINKDKAASVTYNSHNSVFLNIPSNISVFFRLRDVQERMLIGLRSSKSSFLRLG